MKFLFPKLKSSCLLFRLSMLKTGILITELFGYSFLHSNTSIYECFCSNRRVRRIMKSPDPLEEQRRKELQQGELGTGGVFG